MAENYHSYLFDEGIWETQVQSKAKSTFVFWRNRCWNCEQENCSMTRCPLTKDPEKCERNRLKWLSDVQGDRSSGERQSSNDNRNRGDRRGKAKKEYPEWKPPLPSENNKRVIYGRPHTWDGRKSWIEDKTPSSGLPELPPSANVGAAGATIPTQVSETSDEATVMTAETGFTQEDKNELRRFQASIQNMGANLSTMGGFINNLTGK
jgi:hypothetical protein